MEAERIQAEAKARARVSAEASALQVEASTAASRAWENARDTESRLERESNTAAAAFFLKATMRQDKVLEIKKSEAMLETSSTAAFEAMQAWKALAAKRKGDLYARIMSTADLRARREW